MTHAEQTAKSPSKPQAGTLAKLSNLSRATGTGAPSSTASAQAPARPHLPSPSSSAANPSPATRAQANQTTPSRAAVTRRAAAGRGRANASALTADPAHNVSPSAGVGAAHPADIPALSAVNASHSTSALRTTTRSPLKLAALLAISLIALFATTASASAAPPTVTTTGVSEISYTSAKVAGTITSDGSGANGFGDETTWGIQYSTDQVNWSIGFQTGFGTGFHGAFTDKPVNKTITLPKGGTTYFVRLVANNGGFPGADTEVFSPPPYPSFTTLTVDPPTIPGAVSASPVFSTSATATAKVKRPANSDPAFDVSCRFEYITDAQFQDNVANIGPEAAFTGASPAPCDQNPVDKADLDAEPETKVTAPLAGLTPATTYHLRLVAENAGGTVEKDATSTFTTTAKVAAPTVLATDDATEIAKRSAKATGEVQRPSGADPALDVNCRFEFVTDAQFLIDGFTSAGQAPCVENPITSSAPDFLLVTADVSAELPGLEPGTTYHFRLVAENGGGSDIKDAASTFTTIAVIPPTATIDSIDEIGYTGFRVTGTFDPGNQGLFPGFQFSPAGKDEWNGTNQDVLGRIEGGTPPQQRSVTFPCYEASVCLIPLKPGTTYQVRALAYESEFQELGQLLYSPEPYLEFTTLGTNTPPSATLAVSDVTATTAHFSGTVDTHAPVGPLPDDAKAAYRTKWHIECTPDCKDANGNEIGGTVEAEEGSKPFSADVKRLDPNTHYEAKLIATNELETIESVQTFDTTKIKPAVKAFPGGSDGKGGYVLQGTVNPNGSPLSECFFAWGPDSGDEPKDYAFKAGCSPMPKPVDEVQSITPSDYNTPGFTLSYRGQTTAEIPRLSPASLVEAELQALSTIGAGNVEVGDEYTVTFTGALAATNTPSIIVKSLNGSGTVTTIAGGGSSLAVTVEAPLTSLTPDANYNFRLFATNEVGDEKSENIVFKPTLNNADPCKNEQLRTENDSLALPECRAYEMVTPPGKEGFDASLETYDGDARVAYDSKAGNLAKSGQGSPTGNSYVAERTASGWQTIPNLNGSSGSFRDAPNYVDSGASFLDIWAYSRDLLSSVWGLHQKGDPDIGGGGGIFTGFPHLRSPDGTFAPIGPMKRDPIAAGAEVTASADLSHVVNTQPGTEWGPGVYEYVGTGNSQPRRVDLDNSAAPISTCATALGSAGTRSMSSDGATIIFRVFGGCGAGNPPAGEIWARVDGTTSFDVSASHCNRSAADPGGLCNGPTEPAGCVEAFSEQTGDIEGTGCRRANFAAATPDGSRVFFTTTQQLIDEDVDQTNDIYACDIPSGNPAPLPGKDANPCAAFRQVSGAQTGADVESVGATSENGATVLFTAKGVLADNEDALKEQAVPGDHNLYVWRADASHTDGQTAFVGGLDANDLSSDEQRTPQATPDGRYLVFTTATPLLDTDTDSARDVYRYDADTGTLTRVSTNIFGVAGNGAFDARIAAPVEHNPSATISDDGTKIVFTTTEALSAADGNAEPDTYLWTPARVSLISTGSSGSAPREFAGSNGVVILNPRAAISPSGADIYFESAQPLTPADGDSSADVYDARIDGGFSFATPPICTGETCQPPPNPLSPNPPSPANTPNGEGNVKPPKPCPKGKVRKKNGKCVKKHNKHSGKKHHGKKAGHKQGGGK